MSLSTDLISKFVKMSKTNTSDSKKESIVYGEVSKIENGQVYVQLDGATGVYKELPITETVEVGEGDRVIVTIKNHSAIITSNLSKPSGSQSTASDIRNDLTAAQDGLDTAKDDLDTAKKNITSLSNSVVEIETVLSNKVDTEELTASNARITTLETNKLDVSKAEITYATIERLETAEGNIETLNNEKLNASEAEITYATIESLEAVELAVEKLGAVDLEAINASITNLDTKVADIDTLTSKFISGETVTSEFSNSVVSQIGDAQIESAMIKDIDAGKIQSGSIDTNKVNIQSEDGSFVITENRLQIKEGDTVRVQIGKDGTGNYSVSICDADGNVIFSEDGITDDGIPDNIIVNDMVSETADIHASKLDIDSLFEEINGSTNTIKSTQITVDEEGQTLEAKLATLATTESVDGLSETVASQGTQITANTEAIESKIWTQDITTAVEDINIGSRNYFVRKNINNLAWGSGNVILENSAYRGFSFPVEEGETWILYRTDVTNNRWGFYWLDTEPVAGVATTNIVMRADDQEARYINKFTVPSGVTWAFIYLSNDSSEIPNIMLEKGTIASDWTPAPEDIDNEIITLLTQYSSLEQTVDGISATVASHSTEITNKADSSTVTEISNKVTEIETDLDGFKTSVSETYATKSDLDNYSTTEEMESAIEQKADSITSSVSSTYATIESVEVAKDRINTVDEKVTVNTSLIEQLSDSISMLVTDANGASLMTQTETGWTFSTGNIETLVNKTSEDLAALTDSLGSTDHTVSVLEQAVADLGELADYIKITTYEDEPCIELGEGDSEFKLRITNTQMIFTEGSNILAYFNNQALHIKKAVVEEELQQGEYVWITRSNGHLSLIWKGGSN